MMFYTVKNIHGKIVARLRSKAQCEAYVNRVGGGLIISDNNEYKPVWKNQMTYNEWVEK